MKKTLSLTLAFVMILGMVLTAFAAGTDANGGFTIDQNGTLTKYTGPGGHVVIPDGVKTVGASGFYNCTSLLSVTFPDSVTSIRSSAFRGCSALKEVTLPAGVTSIGSYAFQDCKSLEKINIPDGVTRIETSTFDNCLSLKEIVLPNGITQIDDNAFEQCTSLARINIPNGVTGIGSWAFCKCYALTQITLPDSLTGIGTKAFAYSGLTEIDIPGSVRIIDRRYESACAFEGCSSLTKAVIREGVTTIASNEFWNCTKLTTVYIPKSVTQIGDNAYDLPSSAFTGATALTDVHYAGTQAQWDQIAIHTPKYSDPTKVDPLLAASVHYNSAAPAGSPTPTTPSTPDTPSTPATTKTTDANGNTFEFSLDAASSSWTLTRFTAGPDPKAVTVPATVEGKPVKAIGSMAFAAQTAVETVQLPDAVTSIGDRAFLNCWGLKTVNIPGSATIIGDRAFESCKALRSVTFPNTLTTIEANAFWNCTSLTSVAIPDSVVDLGSKTVGADNWGYTGMVFAGCSSLKDISVGSGASDFYRAFMGTAVETAVVPMTVSQSLNTQSTIFPHNYQAYEMYKDCKNLKTAYVESGVKELLHTFSGCTELEALYVPKTVTTLAGVLNRIGTADNPNHHVDIYYEGSQTEFDKIDLTGYVYLEGYAPDTASGRIDYLNAGWDKRLNREIPNYGMTISVHYNSYTPVNFTTDHTRTALAAADALYELGLFNGVGNDASGNPLYALDRAPTRYEIVTMLVRLLGKEEEANAQMWNTPFTDVAEWAKPYVGYAYVHGLTNGVDATRFDGSSTATKEQYATLVLRALGYTSGVDFQWNAPWELLAKTGVMLEGSSYWSGWAKNESSQFRREDMVLMSFLSLSAKVKGRDTSLIEKIMDGSGVHAHSYQAYTLPATGSYKKVQVERSRQNVIEYHCNACGYVSYDHNDLQYHQVFNYAVCCGGGSNTYPDPVNGTMRPWYSQVREWTQQNAACTLRVCTVCGKAA